MAPTYAFSAWFFVRALAVIYVIAFASLLVQAKGLWGSRGVMPIAPYMKAVEQAEAGGRFWQVPSVFWLSSSDEFIVGAAITGVVAAVAVFAGFAQGWCLLLCYVLYLSFCNSGQQFMSFQWDALLLEVGFLALFAVPWEFDFTLNLAREPHFFVRAMFYLVLFKLMFLSGAVKLLSGDESWRDLTALKYHFWTQPLPNPLSPFLNALPEWMQQISAGVTFFIELVLPFFIFWKRSRPYAALGFILLSVFILATGNYAFFNGLTLALCFWLFSDRIWQPLAELLPFEVHPTSAAMFPHPVITGAMAVLALISLLWCTRMLMTDPVLDFVNPILRVTDLFKISNSYGLFAVMTKERPEIVIEGSNDGKEWKEYVFKYKPGPLDRPPPIVAPYQPRLDWQMWFAALGTLRSNPWLETLMLRLFENSPDVLDLLETNPFALPPHYLRAKLYAYEMTSPDEILDNGQWWTRKPLRDYTQTYTHP